MSTIDIGINQQDREAVAEHLKRLLADSYTLYLQTHNFHWNVTGPLFNQLHLITEGLIPRPLGRNVECLCE